MKTESKRQDKKRRGSGHKPAPVVVDQPILYRTPLPIAGESAVSWFMRVATRLSLDYVDVERFFGYAKGSDPDFLPGRFPLNEIARRSRQSVATIDKLISAHRSALHVLDLHSSRLLFVKGRPAFRICCSCLNERSPPFWEVRRRFAFEKDCIRHGQYNLPLLFVSDLVENRVTSLATFRIRNYLRSPSELVGKFGRIRSEFTSDFAIDARSILKLSARDATLFAANADVYFPSEWSADSSTRLSYIATTLRGRNTQLFGLDSKDLAVMERARSSLSTSSAPQR